MRPQGGGRRRYGDREVLAAIVFVATSGLYLAAVAVGVLRAVGSDCPSAVRRVEQGQGWAKLHRLVLDELGSRGELDWSRCAIDSVNMWAMKSVTT